MRSIPRLRAISASAALISSACARDSSVFGPTMNTSGKSFPIVRSPIVTWRGVMAGSSNQARLIKGRADERREERVRLEGFRFELGMELHADEPRVIGKLDDFGQHAVRRYAGKAQPGLLQSVLVSDIDLVAMAMPLADLGRAVNLRYPALRREHRLIGADPHRPAKIPVQFPSLQRIAPDPLGHQPDYRMFASTEFRGASPPETREMPRCFDDRHVHAKADTEIRHPPLAGKAGGFDHALGAALPKPAGYEDPVNAVKLTDRFRLRFKELRIDPVEVDTDIVGDAAMAHRFRQRFIAVRQMGVLAEDGDRHPPFGFIDAADYFAPASEIGLRGIHAEVFANFPVEPLVVIGGGDRIDRVDIECGNDPTLPQIAEQSDLLA